MTMRTALILVCCLSLSGCFITRTEYVESAQSPVPYVPRPELTGDAQQDKDSLKRAVRAWEQAVIEYNQGVNEHNTENGYQTFPVPDPYPTRDYNEVAPVEAPVGQ